jgi:uncharacterized membrane protein YkvA (DUF1232 family)
VVRPGYDRRMREDPFPRERVGAMVRRMPAYVRLAWRLGKDPLLSKARRATVIGAVGYLASPIDLVPGIIPVLGQLDDIAVALAAIRLALGGLDADRRRVHLEAVGLADDDLSADLRTVGATTAWIGRAGYRATRKTVVAGARALGAAARTTRAATVRATPAAMATRRVAKDVGTSATRTGVRLAGAAGSALARVPRRGAKNETSD